VLGSQIRNASIAWIRHIRGVVIVGRNVNGAMNDVEVAELFLSVFLSDRVCSYPVTLMMRFRTMRQELTISLAQSIRASRQAEYFGFSRLKLRVLIILIFPN